jgi:hypothetical protein
VPASIKTANLGLTLPGDGSHTTPWGSDDRIITEAIIAIDAHLGSSPVFSGVVNSDAIEARLAALEARDEKPAMDAIEARLAVLEARDEKPAMDAIDARLAVLEARR